MPTASMLPGDTYKLKLIDRVILLSLLPQKASFTELLVISDIKSKLVISQQESEELQLKDLPNGQISWSKEASEKVFEYSFSEAEINIIKEQLKKLNDGKELTEQHIGIYKLFV